MDMGAEKNTDPHNISQMNISSYTLGMSLRMSES
jgi:hypothetical protein